MTPQTTRPPAVAGAFYPASAGELASLIDGLIATATPTKLPPFPKAVVVPHAGYIYSGPTAAAGFARVAGAPIERVVIVGPAHRVYVPGLAWPGTTHVATPLGTVEVDVAAVERLPQLVADPHAHAREHSLEVQLPFMQRLFPGAKVIPIATSAAPPELVSEVLEALWGGPETLIVISSDLSHYHPYAEGRAIDQRTSAKILAFDTDLSGDQACGCAAINGLALLVRGRLSAARSSASGVRTWFELIDLRSSGDTAGAKHPEVVGYGAYALYEVHGQ